MLGLDLESLRTANEIATGGLHPGLTVFLDLDPATGLARKQGEDEAIRIGLETIEFHQRVRDGYLRLMAEALPGRWVKLDGAGTRENVAEKALKAVRDALTG